LRNVLVRVVRTSSAEADRRKHRRHPVDLGARLAGGLGVRVADVSEGGLWIKGRTGLKTGDRGRIEIDGFAGALDFTVRATAPGDDHLELSVAGAQAEAWARFVATRAA
jgi:aerotaxis receptor